MRRLPDSKADNCSTQLREDLLPQLKQKQYAIGRTFAADIWPDHTEQLGGCYYVEI